MGTSAGGRMRGRAAVLLVGAAALVAGCGDSESSSEPAAATGTGTATQAASGEPYKIDVSGHLTGGGSDFYAPRVEGLRVFFDDLNARGGIDGHPVQLKINDDKGDPTVAAQHAQAATDGDALLTVLSASSATIQSFATVVNQAKMPSFYLGACYPPAAAPNHAPNWFCVGPNPITDGYALLDFYFKKMVPEYKLDQPAPAYVSSNAPGNLSVFKDFLRPVAESEGARKGGYLTSLPFDQSDFGSAANAIVQSKANSVIAYSIPSQQNGVAAALVDRNFKGPYIMVGNAPGTTDALMRIKDPSVYAMEWVAPFSEGLALHKTIEQAADAQNANVPPEDLANGWMLGMMLEESLRTCGFPCSREDLVATIDAGIKLDAPEVAEIWGPSAPEWNAEFHTTVAKDYLLVHYDPETQQVTRVGDWVKQDERPFGFPKL